MKRRPLIAGNWKMNGTLAEAKTITQAVVKSAGAIHDADILLCPPFTALTAVGELIKGSAIGLGAQNAYSEAKGAFTGEISVSMLKEVGCSYVIIGHSERRQFFGDTDELIQKKVRAVLAGGLNAILCVGETLEIREKGTTWQVIQKQLEVALDKTDPAQATAQLTIAYEPVWAIGTGRNATPAQAQEVHAQIRAWLTQRFGKTAAEAIRIQYGGSVKPDNALELMSQPDVNGGLIGGASLDPKAFVAIIEAAVQAKGKPCCTH